MRVVILCLLSVLLVGCYSEEMLLHRCYEYGYIKTSPRITCEIVKDKGEFDATK